MIQPDQDSAKVTFPPPLMLLLSILIGVGLQYVHPIRLFEAPNIRWVGYVLILIAFSTVLYCSHLFRKAETDIKPWKTTTNIVHRGPYRFSRNPIYLCFILAGMGVALAANNGWIVLTQIVLFLVIDRMVIQKEEKYLERKFGDSYRSYKSTTRRWI